MSANKANSAFHPHGVDKWVVSFISCSFSRGALWRTTQYCSKGRYGVLCSVTTVWFIPEHFRGSYDGALYKLTYLFTFYSQHVCKATKFTYFSSNNYPILPICRTSLSATAVTSPHSCTALQTNNELTYTNFTSHHYITYQFISSKSPERSNNIFHIRYIRLCV